MLDNLGCLRCDGHEKLIKEVKETAPCPQCRRGKIERRSACIYSDLTSARKERPLGEFTLSSRLAAAPDELWRHAVSPIGVNRELRPLLRMTFPRGMEDLADAWRPGEPFFRSWILLGGFLPVEYDDISFAAIESGRRFLERSSLLSQRVWEHERTIEPASNGSSLTDHVRFTPRLRWLSPVYAAAFKAVFRLRHRNLRRMFGELSDEALRGTAIVTRPGL